MGKKKYKVKYSDSTATDWSSVDRILLDSIREESKCKIPKVNLALVSNSKGFHGRFGVFDFSLLAVCTEDMMPVWEDSCVEIFLKPKDSVGHLAFEFNCIGALYATYVKDEKIVNGKFSQEILFTPDDCKQIQRKSKLSNRIYPEKFEKVYWTIEFFIPFLIIGKYFGNVFLNKKVYYANFFKCGDKLKNPHWISWNKLNKLNFHVEKDFGEIILYCC